jgi:hypothetical protein
VACSRRHRLISTDAPRCRYAALIIHRLWRDQSQSVKHSSLINGTITTVQLHCIRPCIAPATGYHALQNNRHAAR